LEQCIVSTTSKIQASPIPRNLCTLIFILIAILPSLLEYKTVATIIFPTTNFDLTKDKNLLRFQLQLGTRSLRDDLGKAVVFEKKKKDIKTQEMKQAYIKGKGYLALESYWHNRRHHPVFTSFKTCSHMMPAREPTIWSSISILRKLNDHDISKQPILMSF
jgi:hypothetical protein